MYITSSFLLMYYLTLEKSLFARDKNFIRRLLERSASYVPEAYDTSSLCNVTFDLGMCPCKRTVLVPLPQGSPGRFASSDEVFRRMKDVFGESTCGDWATFRGPGQRVLSYSVYGDFPSEYYTGMDFIVPRASEVYPGWNVRFYHRLDVSNATVKDWICKLACKYPHFDSCHAERLPVLGNVTKFIGRMWRFATVGDPLVDRYVLRDSDSPILQREVDAVNEWLQSGKCFHVMRDHPFHGTFMLAGLWGGCGDWQRETIREIRDLIMLTGDRYDADQEGLAVSFARNILWPVAQSNVTIHDSYFCKSYSGSHPFPSQRVNSDFVGQRSYLKEFRGEKISTECPVECRPRQHLDWLYC
ncbi:uncharacterized protein [Macrobrachium rosenbergii]|uniref:uncharacterized protein n=1 Tax=Macrobrachium rosenbergii TaxID=79674 RepID=UPI0034D5B796